MEDEQKLRAAIFRTPYNGGFMSFTAHFFDGDRLEQTLKLSHVNPQAMQQFENFVQFATSGRCSFVEVAAVSK
jgi:hypothetical protein